uniref:Guanylate-binding family protein n=1 Tax=Tetraselmis sp. GSL018 TaxID=582737 RepID=A0A061RA81_9CHLO
MGWPSLTCSARGSASSKTRTSTRTMWRRGTASAPSCTASQPRRPWEAKITGRELAQLVRQVVKILNTHKIPTVTNIIDSYNSDVVARCLKGYVEELDSLQLPVDGGLLESFHKQALSRAMARLEGERFGRPEAAQAPGGSDQDPLAERLAEAVEREHKVHVVSNQYESSKACEQLELSCEDELEQLRGMRVPSLRKFEQRSDRCHGAFERGCLGPSLAQYSERLAKARSRARKEFLADYNSRLFQGLLVASLALIGVFRFLLSVPALELCGWALFLGLECSGQLGFGATALYDTAAWRILMWVWESAVYNGTVDLETHWAYLLAAVGLGLWLWLAVRRWRRGAAQPPLAPLQGVDPARRHGAGPRCLSQRRAFLGAA